MADYLWTVWDIAVTSPLNILRELADGSQGSFGDHVRIIGTPATIAAGYADRIGMCYGFTTPSITGIEVIGQTPDDLAFNIGFEGPPAENAWFASALVAFVDYAAGTVATIGDQRWVRGTDGEWAQTSDSK